MKEIDELEQKIGDIINLLRTLSVMSQDIKKEQEASSIRDLSISKRAEEITKRETSQLAEKKDITAQKEYVEKRYKEIEDKLIELKSHEAENRAVKAEREQLTKMKDDLQGQMDKLDQEKEIGRKRNELLDLKEKKINEKQAALQRYLSDNG